MEQTRLEGTTIGVFHVGNAVVSVLAHGCNTTSSAASIRTLLVGLLGAVTTAICCIDYHGLFIHTPKKENKKSLKKKGKDKKTAKRNRIERGSKMTRIIEQFSYIFERLNRSNFGFTV